MSGLKADSLRQVIAAEQIQKRVKELGRHISDDYQGQTIQALAVLENAFMFMADLVRALDVPVVCQFIKPKYSKQQGTQSGGISGDLLQPRTGHSGASIFCWSRAWCIPG